MSIFGEFFFFCKNEKKSPYSTIWPLHRKQNFFSMTPPGDVVDPAYGVDVLLYRPLLEHIVAEVQHGQLVVDENGFRQKLQVAVGQVG